jgi:hypothetical protein
VVEGAAVAGAERATVRDVGGSRPSGGGGDGLRESASSSLALTVFVTFFSVTEVS